MSGNGTRMTGVIHGRGEFSSGCAVNTSHGSFVEPRGRCVGGNLSGLIAIRSGALLTGFLTNGSLDANGIQTNYSQQTVNALSSQRTSPIYSMPEPEGY